VCVCVLLNRHSDSKPIRYSMNVTLLQWRQRERERERERGDDERHPERRDRAGGKGLSE
jgi:hypothetical protein